MLVNPEPVQACVGCAFGPFVVDFVRQLAWCDGKQLPLTGKSFEVLAFLIANRDRVVAKDDLLREIWPDTFVQENNLVKHVSTLRKTLGQRPDDHDYILTVQGRGYRFVAEVTELATVPASPVAGRRLSTADSLPQAATSGHEQEPAPDDASIDRSAVAADTSAAPPVIRRAASSWWRAATAVAAVGLALAVWSIRGASTPDAAARVLRPVTYGPNRHVAPAWSPDGQALAYASDRDGNFDIFVHRTDQSDPIRLTTSPAIDWQPAWSPNGQSVAFRSERDGGGIFTVPVSGGPVTRVTSFGFEPRWSPDGSMILFVSSQTPRPRPTAYVVGLDGASPTPVLAEIARQLQGPWFAWHPDGRVSVAGTTRDRDWRLITASLVGGQPVISAELPSQAVQREALGLTVTRFVWAPDGRHVYLEGQSHGVQNLWRIEVDPATLVRRGSFERLTTGQGIDRGVAVSPDGRHVAFEASTERTRIWSLPIDAATGQVSGDGSPVTPGAAGEFDAAVSRDGQQLVYRTVRDGRQELWQHSMADGRERRLIADSGSFRSSPRWSPDGASLVYQVSTRGPAAQPGPGRSTLAILPTSGGKERMLTAFDSHQIVPDDWSGDSRSILGACRGPNPNQSGICLVNADGSGGVRLLASDPARWLNNARFSPVQRWMCFTASGGGAGRSTVYVRLVEGGPTIPMTDGTAFEDKARWAADGRTLYFVSDRAGFLNVWGRRFDPAAGEPVGPVFQVTKFDGLRRAFAADLSPVDVAVTADRLFLPMTETSGQIWILELSPRDAPRAAPAGGAPRPR